MPETLEVNAAPAAPYDVWKTVRKSLWVIAGGGISTAVALVPALNFAGPFGPVIAACGVAALHAASDYAKHQVERNS